MAASEELRFVGEEMLHLPGPGPWVSLKRFEFSEGVAPEAVLESLVVHPDYLDLYQGSHVVGRAQAGHGPYRIDALGREHFVVTTADEALAVVRGWFEELYAGRVAETELRPALKWITPLFATRGLYALAALGEADRHATGWIVGADGFHEWVALRESGLDLIVASDD